jgi:ligand-binding SRPBCC domain-containing protein
LTSYSNGPAQRAAQAGEFEASSRLMTTLQIETRIRAPIELCFDLARDVTAHAESCSFTSERVVPPGRTSGLLEPGELVAFEGLHFGVMQRFIARIVEMRRPERFVDEMIQGGFRRMRHVHEFRMIAGETVMRDTLEWEAPFGFLGRLADIIFLRRHLEWFVRTKQNALKRMAEERAAGRAD